MSRDLSAPLRHASLDTGMMAATPGHLSTGSERAVETYNSSRRLSRAGSQHAAAADPPGASRRVRRWIEVLPAVIGLVLFLAALEVLRIELRTVSWVELMADVTQVARPELALAIALTVLNYVVLTGYDLLAFVYIGKALPRARVMLTSFLAYAIANNVSFAMLSGASVRYRFYSRWGVTAGELSRIVFSYSVTFWLGLFALGGVSLIVMPLPAAGSVRASQLATGAGWMLILIPVAYLIATLVRRSPLRLWRLTLTLPTPRVAAAQFALSVVDWALAGAVLYVLLPASHVSFLTFMGAFLVSILLGMASHVPGGLGIFEGLMVLLFKPYLDSGQLLPALVVYRAVYYLLPLTAALLVLIADELHQRREHVARASATLGRLSEQLTPRALAAFTFFAGFVLLFSGATPAESGRLAIVGRLLPIGVIQASHFVASVAGAGLLVLSQGLARRLDGAYYLTATLMLVGITTSPLKGFDYEEAALLCMVLALLHRARPAFDRRAAFFETRFSARWTAAVIGAVGASVWLGLFAFQHVQYSNELWWQFELQGDASRFLRASVGAGVVLLLVAVARLVGYAPHEATPPTDADLRDAVRVIAAQSATFPNLAFLGDKALLFDDERTAFVMYGVQGRTWVALGDPVGPVERWSTLIRLFLERCHDFGGVPVFYEITPAHLHRYADFGLTFVKLGEEAKVDLQRFTLEGGHAAKFRQALRRLERERGTFRMVDVSETVPIMQELRAVSDEWLAEKSAAEKGFSLGYFDESYLRRFAIAVIERDDRIEAFANVWPGAGRVELSIDLTRHRRDAPNGVMEALFVHLMLWGKEQGYQRFSLGMAPLSGFEQSPVASLWNRTGAFIYEHGESFYNFQGLRAYKEKFNPAWEARYLACPGGLRLPRILADVSALIAGGYRRIFLK
jgi:phosphatidylglycerol lysyltransferase